MTHFISNHSPMDDYMQILQQVDYKIDNEIENSYLACNNREKLDGKTSYKRLFKSMKLCLILTAVLFVVVCVMFGIWYHHNDSTILKSITLYSTLAVVSLFMIALVLGGIGAYMESHNTAKDKRNYYIKRHKTWVLLNGNIVVVQEARGRGNQMLIQYVLSSSRITEIPFSEMYIIDDVYSVSRKNNKLIATVDATKYFLKYPFVSEYSDDRDNVEQCFNYYTKRTHTNMEWDENLREIDKLCYALNALKRGTRQ